MGASPSCGVATTVDLHSAVAATAALTAPCSRQRRGANGWWRGNMVAVVAAYAATSAVVLPGAN